MGKILKGIKDKDVAPWIKEAWEKNNSKTYSVSLTLSITATNEQKAIRLFYCKVNEIDFDRDSIEIEEEV